MKRLLLTLPIFILTGIVFLTVLPTAAEAASRYWVGGANSPMWNATNPTNWGSASNTQDDASVPTSSDDVIFDGVGTGDSPSILGVSNTINSLDMTGYTNTLTHRAAVTLTISGNTFTLASGMTYTLGSGSTSALAFTSTSGTTAITTAGKTVGNLTFNGTGGTFQLQDALTSSGATITLTAGTFDANSKTATFSAAAVDIVGAFTWANLTRTGTAATTNTFEFSANQTITGTLTIDGNSITNRMLVASDTIGTARTLTAAAVSVSNVDFRDITGAGAGSWDISAGSTGDCQGNSGITFTTATTRYWVGGTGSWSSTGEWSASSGGASGASVPLCHDDVVFDNGSFSSTSQTATANMPRSGKNIDFSAYNEGQTPTFAGSTTASSIFGSFTFNSGMNLTGTGIYTFQGRSTYTITSAGKAWLRSLTINAPGGTYTIQDGLTITTTTLGLTLTNGTFNANDQAISIGFFSSSNSNVRTLSMGTGTWSITGNNTTVFSMATETNATVNASSSTLDFTYSGSTGTRTISTGDTTVRVNIIKISAGTDTVAFTTSVSAHDVDFTGFAGTWSGTGALNTNGSLTISSGLTRTYTGAITFSATTSETITLNGKTLASAITFNGTGGTWTLAALDPLVNTSTITLTDGTFDTNDNNITSTTFSSSNSNTRALDMSNTTWTLTGNNATIWTTSTATNLTLTATSSIIDATYSGTTGTRTIITSTATNARVGTFKISAGSDIVSFSTMTSGDIDFTGFSGKWAGSGAINTTGSITLSSGLTRTYTGAITFSATATGKTITSAGQQLASAITFNGTGGGWTLADALYTTSTLTLTAGTFDAATFNVTATTFSSSGSTTRVLTMGSGTWTLTGSNATIWTTATSTGLTLTPGSSTIVSDYTGSTGTRTFTMNTVPVGNLRITAGFDTVAFTSVSTANLDFTGFSGTWSGSTALNVSGNFTLSPEMTNSFTGATTFSATSSKTVASKGKTLGGAVTFNGASGTWTLQDHFATSSTITHTQGTIDANNFNVTATTFDSSNANTRTITMGSGTWTLTGNNATIWTTSTSTNLTLTPGASTLDFTYSGATGTRTITMDSQRVGKLKVSAGTDTVAFTSVSTADLDFTGFSGTWSGSTALDISGNLTISSGLTRSFTGAITFSATSVKSIAFGGQTMASAITFNGVSGEWILSDSLNDGTSTITLTNGTLNVNNQTVTAGIFASSGAGTRTLTLGSGTLNLGSTGTVWDTAATLTLTSNTGTINVTDTSTTSKTFAGSGLTTYYIVTFSGDNITVTGSNTFNTLNVNNAGLTNGLKLTSGTTQTLTNFSSNGSAGSLTKITAVTAASAATITKSDTEVVNEDYLSLQDITPTPDGVWFAGYNSTNTSGNTGWTFTAKEYSVRAANSYWKFDDGTGSTTEDSIGANDGTITGAAWATEDMCTSGKCLGFDGSDDVVTVTNANSIDLDGGLVSAFSISGWFLADSDGEGDTGQIIQKGTSTYIRVDSQSGTSLDVEASLDLATTDATVNASAAVTSGHWNHFAITYTDDSDDEIDVYINGVLAASSTNGSGAPASDSNNLLIGGTTTANFDGKIEEIKVYQYAITAAQVKANFKARGAASSTVLGSQTPDGEALSSGLVGYWKMDESSGNAADSSGNGTTLTNNNTTAFSTGKFGNAGSFTAASSHYFSTATTISGVQTVAFWVNPSATTDEFTNLTASAYITASSGTVSATGFTSPSIYVNGVLNGSVTASAWNHVVVTTGSSIAANAFEVGRANSSYVNGSMDEVRVYNRALSPDEVSGLYNFAPGPVGYWNMEEGTGTTANDRSGNANTGTITAGTGSYTSGKYGKGYSFDAANTIINAGSGTTLDDLPASGMTVEAWIYPKSIGENSAGFIINKNVGTSQSSGWILLIQGTNTVQFVVDGSTDLVRTSSNSVITLNAWNHVVLSWDGVITTAASADIYVNGVEVSYQTTTNGASRVSDATSSLYIGNDSTQARTFDGYIDEAKIYNYARSAKQIVEDMNAGHPSVGSPVGSALIHYKFDEGTDNTCSGGTNDVCNSGSTGSTYDGAMASFASPATSTSGWTQAGKFGKALIFDATDDTITSSKPSAGLDTQGSVTMWTKLANAPSTNRLAFGAAQGVNGLFVGTTPGGAYTFRQASSSTFSDHTGSAVTVGTWAHVALVWDTTAGTIKLYVNGKEDISTTTISGFASLNSTFNYGSRQTASLPWDGQLDEIKVYGFPLTADEVKLDMNHGSAQVLGTTGTSSTGSPDSSQAREYCVPGDSSTCDAPVGEWDFNEGTGTTANDKSGNGFTGTWQGTATNLWAPGKLGKGGNFNGSDNSVTVADNSTLDIGTSDFTISGWTKFNSTASNYFLITKVDNGSAAGAAGRNGYGIWTSTSTLVCLKLYGNSTVTQDCATVAFSTNTWYHIAISADRDGNASFYLNGALVTTESISDMSTADLSDDDSFTIGSNNNIASYLNGVMDGVRVYTYARTPAQIAWDFNRGAPVGYWKFDECRDATANDSSGNSNSGTITVGASGTYTAVGTCGASSASTMWYNGATGKRNYSLAFDGTDDYVTRADDADFDFDANTSFSVSSWVKSSSAADKYISTKRDTSAGAGWMLYTDSSGFFKLTTDDAVDEVSSTGTTSLGDGSWHFVTAVFNRVTNLQKIYVDGVEQDSDSIAAVGTVANSRFLTIGANNGPDATTYWNGQIDDVKIFNYSLTATQVKNLMNDGAIRYGPVTGAP